MNFQEEASSDKNNNKKAKTNKKKTLKAVDKDLKVYNNTL